MLAAERQKRTQFTTQTARAAAAKSNAIRRTNGHRVKKAASTALAVFNHTDFIKTHSAQSQAVMSRLILLIDSTRNWKAIDALTKSYERMHSVWSHLTGTPFIGQVRPEKMRKLLFEKVTKAMSEPSLEQPLKTPVTNTPETSGLTGQESPPTPNQEPPSESPPKEQPNLETILNELASSEPEPEPLTCNAKESLNSPEPTVTTPATQPHDVQG
jgi:hypothetical protein